jgi:acetyl esterase/lipase
MPSASPPPMSRRTLVTSMAALIAAGCSRAAFLAANVPAMFGAYTRHTDVRYAAGAGAAHLLDVYVADKPPHGPRPLVVFWYGGRWTDGDKSDYKFVGAALAGLGYVAMLPNYRHYPDVKMAGFMADAAEAVQWAVAHAAEYGADPSRLFLMGHSAGAHIAALLALDTSYLRATGGPVPAIAGVISLSGPLDFLPWTARAVSAITADPFRARRRTADAVDSWCRRHHGVAEEFDQYGGGVAGEGRPGDLENLSQAEACRHGRGDERAGERQGAHPGRHRGLRVGHRRHCRGRSRGRQPAAVILKMPCALPLSKRRSRRRLPSAPVTMSREMNS